MVDASTFSSVQQKVQIIYAGLISNFQTFAKDKYLVDFTEQEAESIIWLSSVITNFMFIKLVKMTRLFKIYLP